MASAQRQLNGLKFSVERKCREREDDDHTAMMQNHCFGEKLLQGSEIAVSLRKFLKNITPAFNRMVCSPMHTRSQMIDVDLLTHCQPVSIPV